MSIMRFHYKNIIPLYLLFMASCSAGQNNSQQASEAGDFHFGDNLENAVIGTWKNNAMEVEVNTFNNTDTSFQVSVNESSWKIIMAVNPIITEIKEDGSFHTEYRDTLNQVFNTNRGIWYMDGDSLFLEDQKGYKFSYKILIKDDEMELQSVVDYDDDGAKDDRYFGKYLRVK